MFPLPPNTPISLELARSTHQVNTPSGSQQWSIVDELALIARQSVRRFEPVSCLNALYDVSWSSARQLPSLAFLVGQALAGEAVGERQARSADVAAWLQGIRRRLPVVDEYQQTERLDPDLSVHVFWDNRMWPLHPGMVDDPEHVIERLRRYAIAADHVLVPSLGFGIADVVKIGLHAMAIQRAFRGDPRGGMSSAEDGDLHQPASASLIESCRKRDAEGLPAWLSSTGGINVDGRVRAAIDWCARDARDVARSTWLLDGALLVRTSDALLPVPAALVLDALATTGAELLALAGRTSRVAAASLSDEAEHAFTVNARGLATHFAGPVQCAPSGRLTAVMLPAARRLIAVQVAVGTSERETAREADRARRRLAAVKVGHALTIDVDTSNAEHWATLVGPDSPLTPGEGAATALIAKSTVIRRVVVIDGPWNAPDKIRPGTVFVTLDEWRQIAAGAGDDHEEFWAFLDELAELPGLRMIEGATPLGLWETFQRRGILFDGSMALSQPGPDFRNRWNSRAACDPYEIVLRRVGLPGLRDWPFAATVVGGCLTAGQTTPYEHVVISAEPELVFVVNADNADERLWTQLLGDAILAGLTGLASAAASDLAAGWRAWTGAIPDPIRIAFHALPPSAEQAVKLIAADGITVVLGYLPPTNLTATPLMIHQQLGDALWCLLVGTLAVRDQPATGSHIVNADTAAAESDDVRQAGEAFKRAWAQLPPTATFLRTVSAGRPATGGVAASISEGARARAQRSIANHTAPRAPLSRALDDHNHFLHNEVISGTVELLHNEIAQFGSTAALRTAAAAVERLWAARVRTDDDRVLRRALGFPTENDVDDVARTNIVASRAADLLAEAIVGHCPDTGLPMDHRDWHRLFNLAAVVVHLLGSRDQARAGISFDGQTDPAARDLPFYGDRYAADLHLTHDARHGRMLLNESELDPAWPQGSDDGQLVLWTDSMHGRIQASRKSPLHQQAAKAALRANNILGVAYGTGCDEILAVLTVAAGWETSNDIAEVRVIDLVDTARRWSGLQPDRIHRAVDLLTLRTDIASRITIGGQLASLGERLSGRPLLPVPDRAATLILMPRRVARSAKLLFGYLEVARLPWPDAPAEVIKAFKDWEQCEQKAFEADVEREAEAPDRILIPRLKPRRAEKWGITIPGEIDLIAIDVAHRRVFVMEAKAGHVATDIERVLYDIIDFHGAPDSGHARWEGFRPQRGTPYLPKLVKKAGAIRGQLDALLRAHGLDTEMGGWTVVEMVVTPAPIPAAYVPQPLVPFATIDCLSRILADSAAPCPGPNVRHEVAPSRSHLSGVA
ncbi:hypothetical protein AB0C02_26240 [Micromonospora sp. NPDC048999]|uniref:hypothetical protein n=1 Tax=Micromonospora sp. NPDC048999 TaxID=3155391 RepID=UPI0034088627